VITTRTPERVYPASTPFEQANLAPFSQLGINSIGIAAGAHKENALLSSGAKLAFPDFLGFSSFASSDPEGFRGYFSKLNLP
jgi:hypothetical protein